MKSLLNQSKVQIDSLSTKEARQLYNWHRQVASCYDKSRSFARLKIDNYGILYGEIEPEHFVEDLVSKWFMNRFPLFTIVISSSRGCFVASKKELKKYDENIDTVLKKLRAKLTPNDLVKDLEDFNDESFWETYYSTQLIKERKNKRYFQHNMAKKYQKWNSLKTEKKVNSNNKTLDEY